MMSVLKKDSYSAVVIGGGPAGLSAATWIARHRYDVLVIDSQEYRNRWVDLTHGFFGSDPISPSELLSRARSDLKRYRTVELLNSKVSSLLQLESGTFRVEGDGFRVDALRLVIATGVVDVFPKIERFFEHYGRDVFHCPLCDGYEAEGKDVVVLGWTDASAAFAKNMLHWSASVTLIVEDNGLAPGARRELENTGVRVLDGKPAAFEGRRGGLEGVRLSTGDLIECHLAFFSLTDKPKAQLTDQLGCKRTEEGPLAVDENCQTSIKGVFAAGDITPGEHLIAIAVAKGTVAGVACAASLARDRVTSAPA